MQFGGKNIRNYIQYFLSSLGVVFLMCIFVNCICLACICCILCVFAVPYVYLLYYVCIAVLTLDAGLLARSQYPATSTQVFLGFPVSTSEC